MAKKRRRKRIKKADIVTPAEAKAKEEESKKKKKVVIPPPKQDKKPEKKPETDLQDLGRHNLNLVPLLPSDTPEKDCLIKANLYPPDPREIFSEEEMGDGDKAKVSTWVQIMSSIAKRFPLLELKLGDEESSQPDTVAFIDEEYQCKHWPVSAPPTWMDPHVFAGMLLKDKQFIALLKESAETNSRKHTKAIIEVMQKCFDEKYLPYLLEQFNKVKSLMANWFLARQTWVQGEEYKPGPERKKKKPKTA